MGTHQKCTWNCGATDCAAPTRIVTVGPLGHGMQEGDIVATSIDGTRWQKLKRLLARPRLQVVGSVTNTTFTLRERRMTWREWGSALWVAMIG